jgi:antitoxin (DNA-binding transcriptional repressor) of toxin-antitoxin stability system
MKTATVRDLRNQFPRVAAWIENGEEVDITKSGKVFARLVPVRPRVKGKVAKVDFARQLRKTWGNRMFSAAEVAAMRAAEQEDEEG